jgi:tRNA threonylcarbamoyladenosine biosynthesis protein TsaB
MEKQVIENNNLPLILLLDTSSTTCSVGLSKGESLIDCIESNDLNSHAEMLHVFINNILRNNNLKPQNINAIAVNKGPGSYTGLRIGVSAAKGLAFAINCPLIGISSLHALCYAVPLNSKQYYLPMLDARRMEVYTCLLDSEFNTIIPEQAKIINENSYLDYQNHNSILCLGNGAQKCKSLLSSNLNIEFLNEINSSVKNFHKIAYLKFINKQFEDLNYFEPNYLKDYFFK